MLKATGKVKVPTVELLAPSVAVTMNVDEIAVAGGVPERTPLGLIDSQGPGRPVADQVQAQGFPPSVAAKVCEYRVPTVAAGSGEVVVMVGCAHKEAAATAANATDLAMMRVIRVHRSLGYQG